MPSRTRMRLRCRTLGHSDVALMLQPPRDYWPLLTALHD